ncbi:DUF6265 family protein [Erythrobacter sp. F6033]|uniref:DUF6265 family protein n=1 Tax=Erythrobacter sp. F6033 TaxID=2926401 RepID=UPI001FF2166C|nr:DUF6265 family protein [Erythrobacter sp. F6033]MCK0129836.1 DUF1311 domain-containing protein [Erythrobacter sp. F6033]
MGVHAMLGAGRIVGAALALSAFASAAVAQDGDYETRLGEEGFKSPPATLDQMDWLVGQWTGTGIQGAPAMESWLPESGGTMVGTFVQEKPDGAIMFTEHMYLMEEGGTLALKLKHFNADLTGWEEKDGMLTFRLVAIEPCAAYFNALTLRCADPDNPGSGIVAAVRMKSDKPVPQELIFRFDQMSAQPAGRQPGTCDDAYTTFAMNGCYADLLRQADALRSKYLAAALEHHSDRAELAAKITAADLAFTSYRDAECGAVYEDWKDGTIRGLMSLTCRIGMTDKRTRTIWQNWLTYADSTPPVLPEPAPTR